MTDAVQKCIECNKTKSVEEFDGGFFFCCDDCRRPRPIQLPPGKCLGGTLIRWRSFSTIYPDRK